MGVSEASASGAAQSQASTWLLIASPRRTIRVICARGGGRGLPALTKLKAHQVGASFDWHVCFANSLWELYLMVFIRRTTGNPYRYANMSIKKKHWARRFLPLKGSQSLNWHPDFGGILWANKAHWANTPSWEVCTARAEKELLHTKLWGRIPLDPKCVCISMAGGKIAERRCPRSTTTATTTATIARPSPS